MKAHRLHLEQTILGACLLENSYWKVANILKSINFTPSDAHNHQNIWKAISCLYPKTPIDMISVNHYLIEHGEPSYAYYLSVLTRKVNSSANIIHHAACLLEWDIKDRLLKMIQITEISLRAQEDFVKAGLCHDVHKVIATPLNNVFKEAESAVQYFHSYGLHDLSEEIHDLIRGMDARVSQVKKIGQFNTLVSHLATMMDDQEMPLTTDNKHAVKVLLSASYSAAKGEPINHKLARILKEELI